jgi:paraquat-inducible protein B
MPEPISSATVSQISKAGTDTSAAPAKETAKTAPSKFDEVRQAQQAQQTQPTANTQQIPELKTQVTAEQRKVAEADLRKRLDSSGGASPQAIFKPDMRSARVQLDALHRKAQAVPAGPAADALRDRLSSLDAQFQDSGKMLESMNNVSSPGDMLKFQMQMYQFTENMNLMSKTVEQITGGAKQILQTQV